jgi:hypothetical protein
MKTPILSLVILLLFFAQVSAQSGAVQTDAARTIQQSQSRVSTLTNQDVQDLLKAGITSEELIGKIKASACDFDLSFIAIQVLKTAGASAEVVAAMGQAEKIPSPNKTTNSSQPDKLKQILIPAGTQLDIEASYTVDSSEMRAGDLLSFRVVIPVRIDGVIVIEKGALVTARVLESKHGGHWGRAGRLAWTMLDVVAADGTRIPVQTVMAKGQDRTGIKGVSYGGEVATKTVVTGLILFPIAPIALVNGFKRGENAVLPEGKRAVVFVRAGTTVKVDAPR